MPYQVTMDRTLSDTDIDRLIQSELNRRKYNTVLTEETDEEFITAWKEGLQKTQDAFPSGRFRNIRWQAGNVGDNSYPANLNPEDPLGLEAHPTENVCPIIFSSFCHPCNGNLIEGDLPNNSFQYWWTGSESLAEQIQNDWNTNGQSGDFRDTLGIVGQAMFAGNTDTKETSADIIKRWSLAPHEKGFTEDIEKISLVPMIEFFKSLGVTHHGYYILGQKPKEYVLMMKSKTNWPDAPTINGQDREESPNDFPYEYTYGMSQVDGTELTFVPHYLNAEDRVQNGPEIVQDYGWPGTR